MVTLAQIIPFAAIALGMVLTPGPNMIYLISRSLCQGRRAGYISLAAWRSVLCFIWSVPRWGLPRC